MTIAANLTTARSAISTCITNAEALFDTETEATALALNKRLLLAETVVQLQAALKALPVETVTALTAQSL